MNDDEHVNSVTRAYLRYGLPATLPADQRQAWTDYQAGRAVPMRLLPTNGDRCSVTALGGSTCGYPLLVDGTCPNAGDHADRHH